MNICTTIEQSKHLLELGLKLETADMYYPEFDLIISETPQVMDNEFYPDSDIPAWSLSALLDLMPKFITIDGKDYFAEISLISGCVSYTHFGGEIYGYPTAIMFENDSIDGKNSLLNNVYRMICWLIEHEHIKTDKL